MLPDETIAAQVPLSQLSFLGPRSKDGREVVIVDHCPQNGVIKAHVVRMKKKTCQWLGTTIQTALAETMRRRQIAETNARMRFSRQGSTSSTSGDTVLALEDTF